MHKLTLKKITFFLIFSEKIQRISDPDFATEDCEPGPSHRGSTPFLNFYWIFYYNLMIKRHPRDYRGSRTCLES